MDDALGALWSKNRPTALARVAVVRRALVAAVDGSLDEPDRSEALSAAHKLAGSLGMYGFPDGSDVAVRLEAFFRHGGDDDRTLIDAVDGLARDLEEAPRSSDAGGPPQTMR